jgi:hypothetical protein
MTADEGAALLASLPASAFEGITQNALQVGVTVARLPNNNGGTAGRIYRVSGNLFRCACADGWGGDNCELNVPCLHGVVRGSKCHCDWGYTGRDCSTAGFDPVPCVNGDVATSSVGGDAAVTRFTCACHAGWSGERCDVWGGRGSDSCFRGQWRANGSFCECDTLWAGEACDRYTCANGAVTLVDGTGLDVASAASFSDVTSQGIEASGDTAALLPPAGSSATPLADDATGGRTLRAREPLSVCVCHEGWSGPECSVHCRGACNYRGVLAACATNATEAGSGDGGSGSSSGSGSGSGLPDANPDGTTPLVVVIRPDNSALAFLPSDAATAVAPVAASAGTAGLGACVCEAPWTGSQCEALSVPRATVPAGANDDEELFTEVIVAYTEAGATQRRRMLSSERRGLVGASGTGDVFRLRIGLPAWAWPTASVAAVVGSASRVDEACDALLAEAAGGSASLAGDVLVSCLPVVLSVTVARPAGSAAASVPVSVAVTVSDSVRSALAASSDAFWYAVLVRVDAESVARRMRRGRLLQAGDASTLRAGFDSGTGTVTSADAAAFEGSDAAAATFGMAVLQPPEDERINLVTSSSASGPSSLSGGAIAGIIVGSLVALGVGVTIAAALVREKPLVEQPPPAPPGADVAGATSVMVAPAGAANSGDADASLEEEYDATGARRWRAPRPSLTGPPPNPALLGLSADVYGGSGARRARPSSASSHGSRRSAVAPETASGVDLATGVDGGPDDADVGAAESTRPPSRTSRPSSASSQRRRSEAAAHDDRHRPSSRSGGHRQRGDDGDDGDDDDRVDDDDDHRSVSSRASRSSRASSRSGEHRRERARRHSHAERRDGAGDEDGRPPRPDEARRRPSDPVSAAAVAPAPEPGSGAGRTPMRAPARLPPIVSPAVRRAPAGSGADDAVAAAVASAAEGGGDSSAT